MSTQQYITIKMWTGAGHPAGSGLHACFGERSRGHGAAGG